MKFKVGSRIQWKWLGRIIVGRVVEVHPCSVTKTIKGKVIKRNGTPEMPAYLVESESGNLALKLGSELAKAVRPSSRKPRLFS